MAEMFDLKETITTNADKSQVVDENSPDAALQFFAGTQIPKEDAERLGLTKSRTTPSGDGRPESAEPGDAGATTETVGDTTSERPRTQDKAVRGPKE